MLQINSSTKPSVSLFSPYVLDGSKSGKLVAMRLDRYQKVLSMLVIFDLILFCSATVLFFDMPWKLDVALNIIVGVIFISRNWILPQTEIPIAGGYSVSRAPCSIFFENTFYYFGLSVFGFRTWGHTTDLIQVLVGFAIFITIAMLLLSFLNLAVYLKSI